MNEPRTGTRERSMRAEIRDGLAWTYRHQTLGPLAASTHIWFLANGAAMTVLSLLALRSLGPTATTFGTLLAVFGLATPMDASLAPRCADRIGPARTVTLARTTYPLVWLLVALAPTGGPGPALLFIALGLQGLAAGVENANEMGYWQTPTPDELLGRVNSTRRSINPTMAAFDALLAGFLAGAIGYHFTLAGAIAAFAIAAFIVARSPLQDTPSPMG